MTKIILRILITAFLTMLIVNCGGRDRLPDRKALPAINELSEHNKIFNKHIERVGDNAAVAIGYALANSIAVRVDGGKVIIDTTESVEAASEIKKEFDKLFPGPVLAIIYTHTHPDHVLGASVFADEATPIWAHDRAIEAMNEQFASLSKTLRYRGAKQFGEQLPPGVQISNGIGPFLRLDDGPIPPMLYPTKTFADKAELNIGGVQFELMAAPGETRDQIMVWLPEEKFLFSGDNIYQAFPNLYSTRGVPPRPVREWVRSLDTIRVLEPEWLVPSHGGPLKGKKEIQETLTAYRDAIRFIHDSVIRMINEGKGPDDIARDITLPSHLANHPYLKEFYGTLEWSVRGIYGGYLGWFDGNATTLNSLHPSERAAKLIPLLGGRERMLEYIAEALKNDENQWAAELADYLLAVNADDEQAKKYKAEALWRMGMRSSNPNARGYYMSSALELQGEFEDPGQPEINEDTLREVPVEAILRTMPERLNPVKTLRVEKSIVFRFTDTGKSYTLLIRKGVGEFKAGEVESPNLVFIGDEVDFKVFLIGSAEAIREMVAGRVKVEGGLSELLEFKSFLIKP